VGIYTATCQKKIALRASLTVAHVVCPIFIYFLVGFWFLVFGFWFLVFGFLTRNYKDTQKPCEDNCNGHGQCNSGFCDCMPPWTGPTCYSRM